MPIHLSALLRHYKRTEIQNAILAAAENKEVAVKYADSGFGRRPDVLVYHSDVLNFAKKGATSFHCSEEHWISPLQLQPGVGKDVLNSLRLGWDLVLDIDCSVLDYSKIAADLLIRALQHYGIEHFGVKFSGNHGFHIAVSRHSFPERVHDIPIKDWFPEGPRRIAAFLGEKIKIFLAQKMLEFEQATTIARRINKPLSDIVQDNRLNPYAILSIDTVLISSRHLYRMPYSFNEKSGLVSVPVRPKDVLSFDTKTAQWDCISSVLPFLPEPSSQEGTKLITESFDFTVKIEPVIARQEKFHHDIEEVTTAVPVEFFPPCIKLILAGLQDGRKRSLFILTNFLSSVGWSKEQIKDCIDDWNKKNSEPLREVLTQGHLRYHGDQKRMPPNCNNQAYYLGLGVCKPDDFCKKIKNPVNYAVLKFKMQQRQKDHRQTPSKHVLSSHACIDCSSHA